MHIKIPTFFSVLPSLSNAYVIKVQGQVEMGDHIAMLLKFLQSQLPSSYVEKEVVRGSTPEVTEKEEIPFIEEIMRKDDLTHLYGQHVMKNNKYKYVNIKL